MNKAPRHAILGIAVVLGSVGIGCSEHQFLLNVRSPEPIEVIGSSEPVARLTGNAPADARPAGQPFPDRGVRLQTGSELPYWRDGDWLSSVDPVRIAEKGNRISIDFTLHPGRRDLPLTLSTDRENVCELKTRDRSNRAAGFAGLVLGATVGAFVPITALSSNEGTRQAAPYLGGSAAALLIAGAAWVLWPAGADRVVVSPGCNAPNAAQ